MKSSTLTFIFAFMLCISFASALFERTETSTDLKEDAIAEGLVISDSAMKYPAVEVVGFWDGVLWIEDKKADLVLTENTESCGQNCMAEFQIATASDSALIDGITFYKNVSGEWVESNIRSYQFSIWDNPLSKEVNYFEDVCSGASYDEETGLQLTEDVCEKVEKMKTVYYKVVQDYKTECKEIGFDEKNGTTINECLQVESGTHDEEYSGYSNYNVGDVLPAGTYTVRLEGNKRNEWVYDWVITTQHKKISKWAV
jgi:hypothetical protein